MKKLLFVYGTLMSDYGNNVLLSSSKFVGQAETTDNWCFSQAGIPYLKDPLSLKEKPTDEQLGKVRGEVWEVTDEAVLASVDALEGHPTWYCRTPICVSLEGTVTEVESYVYLPERNPDSAVGNYHQYGVKPNV